MHTKVLGSANVPLNMSRLLSACENDEGRNVSWALLTGICISLLRGSI
jgi:hypothetical protein